MRTVWRLTLAQMHGSWLLLPAWMLVMLGWALYSHRWLPVSARRVEDLYGIFEYYLPLAAAIYLAGVPAFDREQGAAETHLSYVQLPAARLLLLALPRLALWAATVALALAITQGWYLSGQTRELLQALGAPALALAGVSLAGGALSRHETGGLIAAFGWWAFDALGRGLFNKRFFLFPISVITGGYTQAEQARNIAWVGVACAAAALWAAHRRSWWIR